MVLQHKDFAKTVIAAFTNYHRCDIMSGEVVYVPVTRSEQGEIYHARDQYVVKANELIRKTRYSLTVQQHRLLMFAISKIKPGDVSDTWYESTVRDIGKVCGLDIESGGTYYHRIKEDLKKLQHAEFIMFPDGIERTFSWFAYVEINPSTGVIRWQYNQYVAPYLFELRQKYTQYRLETVIAMRSAYGIRLYELLRSYCNERDVQHKKTVVCDIDLNELCGILAVPPAYKRWADIKRFAIEPAVREINNVSEDMHVTYQGGRKDGRKFISVYFFVHDPKEIEILGARNTKQGRLG